MAILKRAKAETSTGIEFAASRHDKQNSSDHTITLSAYLPGISGSMIFHMSPEDAEKLAAAIKEALE